MSTLQKAESPVSPGCSGSSSQYKGGIIKEFRVVLPVSVEEYQVAQLYSVAEASKNETGGGEGIEVIKNEPFSPTEGVQPPDPLLGGDFNTGQYTYKVYHLQSKVPGYIRVLAPKGSLEVHEEAWNAYPYCRTVITNPEYMKDAFHIVIESLHLPDKGNTANAHRLTPEELKHLDVCNIDITDKVSSSDYKKSTDPKLFKSQKTGRGPLDTPNWKENVDPVMCAYKLVRAKFKWFGLQTRVEKMIMKQEQRLFTNFHREVFCWMDQWYGLTMSDIRALEDKTKEDLDKSRRTGDVRGTSATDN
ncbi:phosphatidylinositol transfer protein alpha isoform-like [Haliotis rubra]|uniref:phosphatidylinositol transfer protein alpha isoform-like n=1 Tax=Haliotis rubra TaxID=36100 RepID=UPI001EE5724D|nr:phosphatidylinositol transfer protein alpha isoform-like [Haliotis rubra]